MPISRHTTHRRQLPEGRARQITSNAAPHERDGAWYEELRTGQLLFERRRTRVRRALRRSTTTRERIGPAGMPGSGGFSALSHPAGTQPGVTATAADPPKPACPRRGFVGVLVPDSRQERHAQRLRATHHRAAQLASPQFLAERAARDMSRCVVQPMPAAAGAIKTGWTSSARFVKLVLSCR